MATKTQSLTASTQVVLTFGSYAINKITLTSSGGVVANIQLFDCDDTDLAIVHAATFSESTAIVDRYTKWRRSTTAGEEGKPYLLTGNSTTSLDVPSDSAPATSEVDDTPADNDYVTYMGTTQTQKFTGVKATESGVTANSVTVTALKTMSVVASGVTTDTPATPYQISRGLVITSDAACVIQIDY